MDATLTPSKPKRIKPWVWAGCALASLVIGLTVLHFTGHKNTDSGFSPVLVQEGPIIEGIPLNALLTPARVGVVAAVRGGQVLEVIAYPGQKVKAGDALIKLSNPELEQQLEQTLGDRATASADLVAERADMIDQANSLALEKVRATNDTKVAQMQMDAEAKLQAQGIVSLLQLNRTRAELEGKKAASHYADQHLIQAQAASHAKAGAAEERLRILNERAENLQESVDNLTLRAPFDGVVSKIDGKAGAAVPAGTQMAEVITPELQVEIQVAEQFANAVRQGQTIVLEGGVRGVVQSMSPSSEGGVVKGRATLNGDTTHLRSNSNLPGEIVLGEHGKGVFVALPGQGLAGKRVQVQVLSANGKNEERSVQFGARYGSTLVVKDGLDAGDQIVGMDDAGATP